VTRKNVPPLRHGLCCQLGAEPIKFRSEDGHGRAALAREGALASPLTVEVGAKTKELAVTRLTAGVHGEGGSHAR